MNTTPSVPPVPTTTTTSNKYTTNFGDVMDPIITPPSELQAMLHSNAYRIADLVSQLEKSHEQLRKLRTRAMKNTNPIGGGGTGINSSNTRIRKSPRSPSSINNNKNSTTSPRRTRLAPQQSSSPTSIMCRGTTTTTTTTTTLKRTTSYNRGHWNVEEEARFEAAMKTFGPTNYAQITLAVGTRTEKQVRDRAFRQRQKLNKAAEFAALSIPTKSNNNNTQEEIQLSDCSTITHPRKCTASTPTPTSSVLPRPTSPLSAVSTAETEFELAILGKSDLLDEALFQQSEVSALLDINNNSGCGGGTTTTTSTLVANSFDWNCATPSSFVMESFSDVPEFADNFLLLEHAV